MRTLASRRNVLLLAGLALFLLALDLPVHGREPRTRVRVFFSPSGGTRQAISKEIRRARRTLDVAMYVFTSPALATDVIAAHKRGVKVRVLIDARMSRKWSQAKNLEENGVTVKRVYLPKDREDPSAPQFHHKFAVVDGVLVATGSFNWTVMAEEKNHENLVLIQDATVVKAYAGVFDRAWEVGEDAD